MSYRNTLLAGAATAALTALAVDTAAAATERSHPPKGAFLDIDGVRLHVVDRGTGDAVVYLHGNGSMFEEVEATGIVEALARTRRIVVFDRPGFGHSTRPRGVTWTPERQADLLAKAFARLGIASATVVAHSWGTLVALALAIRSPELVRGLVLCSGYYFPEPRSDGLLALPAVPVIGDVMRHTVSPIAGWLMWNRVVAKIFSPNPVSKRFSERFPVGMALRPSQLRAAAEEIGLMLPSAERLSRNYGEVRCPVIVLAGDADKIVDADLQSRRLPIAIPHARVQIVENVGHMLPHIEAAGVIAAVQRIADENPLRATFAATSQQW